MAFYEITVKNPEYTNYDAEKKYGVQFHSGKCFVEDDQMWVTTGKDGPTSTVETPVWKLFEEEFGYTVRRLDPEETPIRVPETKTTHPSKAHD